jgi:hypothetical protein
MASHDQQPVQALGADRADPALRERVGVGCLHRCQEHLGALRAEDVVEPAAEFRVAVAEQEAKPTSPLAQDHEEVASLLGHPDAVGVGGDPGQVDPPGVQFDEAPATAAFITALHQAVGQLGWAGSRPQKHQHG